MNKNGLVGAIVVAILMIFLFTIPMMYLTLKHLCCDGGELYYMTFAGQGIGLVLTFLLIGS